MAKKIFYNLDSEYLLVTILLIFSGNPITRLTGKYAIIFLFALVFLFMYNKIRQSFYIFSLAVVSGLLLIFVSQNLVLGFVSWLGAINYIVTFLFGGLIVYLLGERFSYKLFIVVSYISAISLAFYPICNILNIHPGGILWGDDRFTYIIYTYVKEHQFRNCGMFWEPGAFAGVLCLCLAFNVKEIPRLWKKHKFNVIVIVLALITTQSTTGYVSFFLIGAYFLIFFVRDKTIALTVLPILLVIAVIAYTNVTFLQAKVEQQSESSLTLDNGEFSNTRFGSLIFDMHYIKKHPIIGNGFHESTRYADHPELIQLIQAGVNLADANGFSNFLACLGIPFMFFYFLLSFKAISKVDIWLALLVVVVIFLTLFGEQWLNFPLFMGTIYVKYRESKKINSRAKQKKQYSSINYLT